VINGRRAKLSQIMKEHGVSLAYLFGSQADLGNALLDGDTAKHTDTLADLDLGVVCSGSLPSGLARAKLYSHLEHCLVDLFLPLRLDLVLLQETHSVFQLEAIKGICVYQESDEARDNYEMSILRRAADFAPTLAKFLEETLEEV